MASYESRHARPSPSRRDEPLRRARRDDEYAMSDDHRAGSSMASSRPRKHDRHDSRYHDLQRLHPGSVDKDRRSSRSPIRKRKTWPPPPTAEDEVDALRREARSPKSTSSLGDTEVRSRGTIDQDPLIIEVPEYINQHERRFVWQPGASKPNVLTPPSSEDEAKKRFRQNSLKSGRKQADVIPELSKRTSAPYAFKPSNLQKSFSAANGRFYPPETLTPPASFSAENRSATWHTSGSAPSSPRGASSQQSSQSRARDYFTNSTKDDEVAVDDTDLGGVRVGSSSKRPSRPSADADLASSISQLHVDPQPNVDRQEKLPSLSKLDIDKTRRLNKSDLPTSAADARGKPTEFSTTLTPDSASFKTRQRDHRYSTSSRPTSPLQAPGPETASPKRSPRQSADLSKDAGVSVPRPASRHDSRPPSPRPRTTSEASRMLQSDLDWTALMAANALRRGKPPSRLASSTLPESPPTLPRQTSGKIPDARPPPPLPYPEDDGMLGASVSMPSERDHQFWGEKPSSLAPPAHDRAPRSRTPSPTFGKPYVPAPTPSATTIPPSARVSSAAADAFPNETGASGIRNRPLRDVARERIPQPPLARSELVSLVKRGLPACPRPYPIAGEAEWYSLKGIPRLEFCHECTNDILERSPFRQSIRRSAPRSPHIKIQCAFSSAWNRLAWIFTAYQQNTDLRLLRDMVDIEENTEPCPGNVTTVRPWYGLRDDEGLFVRDFHVCYADVRRIERLLPSLTCLLVRLPQPRSASAAPENRRCAMRLDTNRFFSYVIALISTHEKVISQRSFGISSSMPPLIDPMSLIELIEHKTRLQECKRDEMLLGGLWHFHPEIRELTICEECFEEVVEPAIFQAQLNSPPPKPNVPVSNSSSFSSSSPCSSPSLPSGFAAMPEHLALRFHRTVQPVYGEGLGSSCQLYSRRMRKIFRRAVQDNDMRLLLRKARERRENELRLQEHYRDVLARAQKLLVMNGGEDSRRLRDVEEEERRLNRELERISDEWKEKWE